MNVEPSRIKLLETFYIHLKPNEEKQIPVSIPPVGHEFVLLLSGKFSPEAEVSLLNDGTEIPSKLEGEGEVRYAAFPLPRTGGNPVLKIKNPSGEELQARFYIDSSEVKIKEIPMGEGYFVSGFHHHENRSFAVGCVFPFRSRSDMWVKAMKNQRLEETLYTLFSSGEAVAFKKAEIKEGAGHYFVFSRVQSERGFVNCEAEEIIVARKSPLKKWVVALSLIVALVLAGGTIYLVMLRKK